MLAGHSRRGWLQQGAVWGNMLGKNMLPGDEELGKKDDDHKIGATPRIATWSALHTPLRWRRRRLLLAVALLSILYVCAKNMPTRAEWRSEAGPWDFGQPMIPSTYAKDSTGDDVEPTGVPEGIKAAKKGETSPHTYSGSIRFYRLASSLQGAAYTHGYASTNRNVLFAASSLRSVSTLLPIVCEMSQWNRNHVHLAFMGREDIDIGKVLEINGVDQIKCSAIWHDARPDYSEFSTDTRAESSVRAALTHIHSYLHPQVVITDDALSEDDFFIRGIRAKTKSLAMTLIEGPRDQWDNFLWMARLDAGSLKSWHQPKVEILIQVPQDSSSVIRLLKSIKNADYGGLTRPHITIELPAEVDKSVQDFLKRFHWPASGDTSQISIRRRISSHSSSQEESAVRFLELFYPTDTSNSHVLLLSPQAELSSQYYHYLFYVLLEYKYSALSSFDRADLMGLSLEIPSVLLDGVTKLNAPNVTDMDTSRYAEVFPETRSAPFLWQAPNSHASLLFGDKWAELHSFLSNRVMKHRQTKVAAPRHKIVSETLPSWMEYMLEFMRARGYTLVYPGSNSAQAFVAFHNELYHPPEEFLSSHLAVEGEAEEIPRIGDETFLRSEKPVSPPKLPEPQILPRSAPLHLLLPFDGDLPEIPQLPYLLHTGRPVSFKNASSIASTYADRYREVIGGCKPVQGKHRKRISGSARDLFCFGDEDPEDWEDDSPASLEYDDFSDWTNTKSAGRSSTLAAVPERSTQTASRTVSAASEAIASATIQSLG